MSVTQVLGAISNMYADISAALDKPGVFHHCRICGRTLCHKAGDGGFYTRQGWPRCCGKTMRMIATAESMELAAKSFARVYPSSARSKRPFGRSAFMAGWVAAASGLFDDACPYKDRRTGRGSITFARAYIRRWRAGWRAWHEWPAHE